MQSILDNLYYGNLCPSEKPLIPGSPAEKPTPRSMTPPSNWSKHSVERKRSFLKRLRTQIRSFVNAPAANISPTASASARK